MIQVFLSYARDDGLEAATKLRAELTGMGFTVWRDIEEMRGGLAWKKQLHQALVEVDAVLVLLTAGAVASPNVTWEWQTALVMDKRVIPLLMSPCDVPAELKALHYHRLDDRAGYVLGLAHLARDLMALAGEEKAEEPAQRSGDQYIVMRADKSSIGHGATTVNVSGSGTLDAAAAAQIAAFLRAQQTDGLEPDQAAELQAILRDMEGQMQAGLRSLQAGQAALIARLGLAEQRILAPILARLDAQEATLLNAILDVLESDAVAADELERHLAVIEAALDEVQRRAAGIKSRQLVESVHQVAELASAPGLDAKHKLKVTLPIVPAVLAYEGEIELSSRLNLEETWRALRRWITR